MINRIDEVTEMLEKAKAEREAQGQNVKRLQRELKVAQAKLAEAREKAATYFAELKYHHGVKNITLE